MASQSQSLLMVRNAILRVSNKVSWAHFTSVSNFHQNRQVYENDDEEVEVERRNEDMKQSARETAQNMKDQVKERANETMNTAQEKVKEGVHKAGDQAKETMGWTVEKTKEGAGKTAHNVGKKVKEAWETAKGTTEKIKEKVVGKDDKRPLEDYMEDHLPKRPGDAAE